MAVSRWEEAQPQWKCIICNWKNHSAYLSFTAVANNVSHFSQFSKKGKKHTWLIINLFGILVLSFLWFRKTITTVRLAIIPIDAMRLWRMVITFTFSFLLDSCTFDNITFLSGTIDVKLTWDMIQEFVLLDVGCSNVMHNWSCLVFM